MNKLFEWMGDKYLDIRYGRYFDWFEKMTSIINLFFVILISPIFIYVLLEDRFPQIAACYALLLFLTIFVVIEMCGYLLFGWHVLVLIHYCIFGLCIGATMMLGVCITGEFISGDWND